MARQVEVNGSRQKEDTPYYYRIFNPLETKRITLFGLRGGDNFSHRKRHSPD